MKGRALTLTVAKSVGQAGELPGMPRRWSSGRTTPKGTRPPQRRNHWAGRRWKWLRSVHERVPRHVLATALALADRSSDDTSWVPAPGQLELAGILEVDQRTVRRHLLVLEQLGFLLVLRDAPMRDPGTGRWCRRRTNRYVLTLGRVAVDPRQGPTGHQCPVPPSQGNPPAVEPPGGEVVCVVALPPDPPSGPRLPPEQVRERVRDLKALLTR